MDSTKSASANGLQTVADVILAPTTAFERLRSEPTWGWALAIALACSTVAYLFIAPALTHALQASWPAMMAQNPRTAQLTPAQQQDALAVTLAFTRFAWIGALIATPFFMLVGAVVMLIFNAIGRGSASFRSLWAASVNIGVPTIALGGIVTAVIVALRGADSFNSAQAVGAAAPSLAWIVPSSGPKMLAFLGSLSVFQLWGAALFYIAMRVTARVGVAPAVITAVVIPLAGAIAAAAGAR